MHRQQHIYFSQHHQHKYPYKTTATNIVFNHSDITSKSNYLQIGQPKTVRVHSYKMMSKWTYIMVLAFIMFPWKVAGLNHSTCNVYYKMSHLQQTYMAWLQVWRISDLLNNKPFVNSSKTTIPG